MSFVEFFSLGGATSARYQIANSIPTSKANSDDRQERKKLSDEAKHFE